MLVDEQFRQCVAFLLVDRYDQDTHALKKVPVATTFFVGMPVGGSASAVYAVSARHVIDGTRSDGTLYIRFNLKQGGFSDFPTDQDSWICHPSTDVAVIPLNASAEQADIKYISIGMLLSDDAVVNRRIGTGDEVFFVGLFSQFSGQERNQPILRFGNISLMPHEPIPAKLYPGTGHAPVLIDAYLVEARSWGGQSGSPAFVYYRPDRDPGMVHIGGPGPELLGLVHGHHNIQEEVSFTGNVFGKGKVPINAGIAVVVPAQKIIDVLMQEDLVKDREEMLKKLQQAQPVPTPDTAISEGPFTKEDFTDVLKKVSLRKSDEEVSET
jgi:hypothetical protein